MSDRLWIDSREYKLLLDQAAFAGKAYEKAAKAFWSGQLKLLIATTLDAKDGKASRAEGALKLKKRRVVFFLDTKEGLLARRGIALRSRACFKNSALSGLPELTLKFRTPDVLRAVEYRRVADEHEGKTVLEEDIAPFQIARKGRSVVVAKPRSTYSRFSVSTKRDLDDTFSRLGDVFARFGALPDLLGDRGNKADDKLRSGPTICEWVFQYACVNLGKDLDAEFGFTLWHFLDAGAKRYPFRRAESGRLKPRVAEISFDFETKNGRMDADAAERARTLFIAMQEKLRINRREASKTALGVPSSR